MRASLYELKTKHNNKITFPVLSGSATLEDSVPSPQNNLPKTDSKSFLVYQSLLVCSMKCITM